MNREILFRGKQTDNGEWVEGYYAPCSFGSWPCRPAIVNKADLENGMWHYEEVDPSTVCQFTGLTDKNGVKIFEGDILKWDEKEWGCPFFETVTWNYELFGIRQREWKNFCEVIGNIFDNPELLGENNT